MSIIYEIYEGIRLGDLCCFLQAAQIGWYLVIRKS